MGPVAFTPLVRCYVMIQSCGREHVFLVVNSQQRTGEADLILGFHQTGKISGQTVAPILKTYRPFSS